jgi:hypothetical protein
MPLIRITGSRWGMTDEQRTQPSPAEPDPAPEDELPTAAEVETKADPDRGGTGEPVGADNIREGRVDGLMGGPHQQQGQGQGG